MSKLTEEQGAQIMAAVVRQPPTIPPGFIALTRAADGGTRRFAVAHIVSYGVMAASPEEVTLYGANWFTGVQDSCDRTTPDGYSCTAVRETPEAIDVLIDAVISKAQQ